MHRREHAIDADGADGDEHEHQRRPATAVERDEARHPKRADKQDEQAAAVVPARGQESRPAMRHGSVPAVIPLTPRPTRQTPVRFDRFVLWTRKRMACG
jgi:hypothetical protein